MAESVRIPTITETIGRTPLVELPYFSRKWGARILGKCEFFNPMSSVKDRIGRAMIEAAEKGGQLKRGMSVLEATSGNTGIALAFICAAKGYPLTLVMPETMSLERRTLLTLLGARIILTPGPMGMRGAIAKSLEIARQDKRVYMPLQFENPANPAIHEKTTAEEIWEQTGGDFDGFVAGVGTGGTITGCGRVFKARNPLMQIYAVEPAESAVIAGLPPGPHKIQGIGAGFIPKNLDKSLITGSVTVTSEEAFETARLALLKEGLPAGISTGAALHACGQLSELPEFHGKTIVVILPSSTERYMSTALADDARTRAMNLPTDTVDPDILASLPKGGEPHA